MDSFTYITPDETFGEQVYTSAIHDLLNQDTVRTLSVKEEQFVRSPESSSTKTPGETEGSSPETSTSSLTSKVEVELSEVKDTSSMGDWQNIVDLGESHDGAAKRKRLEKDDEFCISSKKAKSATPSDMAPTVLLTSISKERLPLLSSYDSLFDADDSLSEADAEANSAIDEASTSQPILITKLESRKKDMLEREGKVPAVFNLTTLAKRKVNVLLKTIEDRDYIVQWKQCKGMKSNSLQLCKFCASPSKDDSCRFLGIRALPIIKNGEEFEVLQSIGHMPLLVDNFELTEAAALPDHYDFNRSMDTTAKKTIMHIAAESLIDIFRKGLLHVESPGCIVRGRELQIRAMCDYCSTGLFAASYMCGKCGQEYCTECKMNMELIREEEQVSRPMCHCVKTSKSSSEAHFGANRVTHSAGTLTAISRFSKEELKEVINDMEEILHEEAYSKARYTCQFGRETRNFDQVQEDAHIVTNIKQEDEVQPEPILKILAEDSSHFKAVPSHPLVIQSKVDMTEDDFLLTWSKGHPLVVTDVSTKNTWNPQAFIDRYGNTDCEIVRADEQHEPMTIREMKTKENIDSDYFKTWNKAVKVHEFFDSFGKPLEKRLESFGPGSWKLKDWPPSAEFSTYFPEIYDDFNYAVPMPDYTRRDGCLNISALFPKNANGPDLGPKMYNAWPGEHSKGKKGTTCLHMDVADAVNILLYADEAGEAQAAQWDIFRAEDAWAIREFLLERYPHLKLFGDPIHSQLHFLDDVALQELYQEKGIYSWRIIQKVGQAVFIPAGCAHQVCNLTDCIKVAVDFISPQNIQRCFKLTEEFRGMTVEDKRSWKEDVLQLRAQLWYAWLACRAMPDPPSAEIHQKEKEERKEKKSKAEAALRAAEQAKLEKKKVLFEVYNPKPTSSGRGLKSSQSQMKTKQEDEELPLICKKSADIRSVPKTARKSRVLSSEAPLRKVADPQTISIDEKYIRSLRSKKLRLLLQPLERRWGLKNGSLMRGAFPHQIPKIDCTNCGATKGHDWRCGPTGPKSMCPPCGMKWANLIRDIGGNPRAVALAELAKRTMGKVNHFVQENDTEMKSEGDVTDQLSTNEDLMICSAIEGQEKMPHETDGEMVTTKTATGKEQLELKEQVTGNDPHRELHPTADMQSMSTVSYEMVLDTKGELQGQRCIASAERADASTDIGRDLVKHIVNDKPGVEATTDTYKDHQVFHTETTKPIDDVLNFTKPEEKEKESNTQVNNAAESLESISSAIESLPKILSKDDKNKCRIFAEKLYRAAGISLE